jgi:hypothetical protein
MHLWETYKSNQVVWRAKQLYSGVQQSAMPFMAQSTFKSYASIKDGVYAKDKKIMGSCRIQHE